MARLGKFTEAAAQLQKALGLDPRSLIINYAVAESYSMLGRFDEAMAQYDKGIEIDPAAFLGHFGTASLFWSVYGQTDKAVSWLGKALSRDPSNPGSMALLGNLYLELGDDGRAECWLDRAIRLAPEGFFPNLILSYLHLYRGEYDQAAAYARIPQQAMNIVSYRWLALTVLRDRDLRAGDSDQALAHYEKAYPALLAADEPVIDGTNFQAAVDLAYVLQLAGERERANMLLDRSLAFIRSGIPRLGFYGYGITDVRIYAMRDEKQRALGTLNQAIADGWRLGLRYSLEFDPSLGSIRNDPGFQAIVKDVKSSMAGQLANVKALAKEGDVCVNL